MIRLFYRYARRSVRKNLSDDYLLGGFLQDITKWWFDFARNLVIASLFAYFAQRTGSWLAYVLAHLSFVFFTFFLFHPIFRFMLRAPRKNLRRPQSSHVTLMSMFWFLNITGIGIGLAQLVVHAVAQYQVR